MTPAAWLGTFLVLCLGACASAPPPAPVPTPDATPPAPEVQDDTVADTAPPPSPTPADPGAPSDAGASPASTASYEQVMSVPESVVLNDDRPHLTDNQLNEPMRGVLGRCRVPPSVHVTIKTAVQNGRAIGVTVRVDLPTPKPQKKGTKRISKEAAKAQAKWIARTSSCADHAVRALTWPPSSRRDAFTTTF